ncbi:uncharacterized protein LOC105693757 [Athalia rosae]|uniref:uncharacterized protein LOC105693757 n=1 Tax=Athalia rosae TaxID=37344 RepID=UPI002034353B|nr:uncharacterized protein LOC105693757 [Athalia rosae]
MDLGTKSNASQSIPWNDDDITWSSTESPLTPAEEDAIVTIVVVVIGVIFAIIALFCMGVFIDCRHQKTDSGKPRNPLRLKMPPLGRRRGERLRKNEDGKSLATDMCPNGASDPGSHDIDAIV